MPCDLGGDPTFSRVKHVHRPLSEPPRLSLSRFPTDLTRVSRAAVLASAAATRFC